ncbi:hypothetical protein MHB50_17365 [Siminovitchia sp. FSL H7-0308]|uniref:Transposase n=1 Tax=Siminovitchia thermophila TaxID=1245522 RepID=A0ABS2R5R5_9BACI|nr:hypothetical protein [Siminovitchia thermophila]MBM7715000.1 hypothetical protein [Siminovitchia thermophila]
MRLSAFDPGEKRSAFLDKKKCRHYGKEETKTIQKVIHHYDW